MRLSVIVLLLLLLVVGCISSSVSEKKESPYLLPESKLLKTMLRQGRLLKYEYRGQMTPKGIVLHSTSGLKFYETVREIEKRNMSIHILIDEDGTPYQLMGRLDEKGLSVRGMDDFSIHVSVVGGVGKELLDNTKQLSATVVVVKAVAEWYGIPKNNYDIEKGGIFSHMQAKYKYGGVLLYDGLEPGEEFVEQVINGIGGRFYAESEWKGRTTDFWHFIRENKEENAKRGDFAKGRDITKAPKVCVSSLAHDNKGFAIDSRRLKYVDRGKIEVKGIVLHFTATSDYETTAENLEKRRLSSTIIVDTDGTAYQVLDSLDDKAAAAGGTNDYCIQIEIVGMNEDEILKNKRQKNKVGQVVKELSEKYNIPLDNFDIESNRGVFSHGQAKKRFGRSAWLWGGDFDPGEKYMKEIIEGVGGKYYSEAQWKERLTDKWVFIYDDWMP